MAPERELFCLCGPPTWRPVSVRAVSLEETLQRVSIGSNDDRRGRCVCQHDSDVFAVGGQFALLPLMPIISTIKVYVVASVRSAFWS